MGTLKINGKTFTNNDICHYKLYSGTTLGVVIHMMALGGWDTALTIEHHCIDVFGNTTEKKNKQQKKENP